MSSQAEKIVNVHIVSTTLSTVKNRSLVIPESKEKFDLEQVIELMSPRIPFMDKSLIAIMLQTFNEKVIELASDGNQIDTGLVHIRPVVTGTVPIENINLRGNKLKIVAIPGKALRKCVAKTKLRVSRKEYRKRYITEATNAFNVDEPVTTSDLVKLTGCNLKIMGDFPQCGVWFDNNENKQRYQVSKISKVFNKPKSLIFNLPDDLPAGNYSISVVTCFCGTKRILSKPTRLPNSIQLEVLPSPDSNLPQQ